MESVFPGFSGGKVVYDITVRHPMANFTTIQLADLILREVSKELKCAPCLGQFWKALCCQCTPVNISLFSTGEFVSKKLTLVPLCLCIKLARVEKHPQCLHCHQWSATPFSFSTASVFNHFC